MKKIFSIRVAFALACAAIVACVGWRITSGNAGQQLQFKALEGSPVGLMTGKGRTPLGVAPDLVVSGSMAV
jgi:hypothetical protein